jgi:UDP-N-acetylmuramate--alanine ligase
MVGIGGIGMSSIAEVLLARGFRVTGSDLKETERTRQLEDQGAEIFRGHAADQVERPDVVVYSSAVDPEDNPETETAVEKRIPIIRRSEMLGELMRMKFGVGIAGTHGKTTTTSIAGLVVSEGGFDPTIIVGGKVAQLGGHGVSGDGDIIVIEADEYDRTFLRLTPVFAVITSLEAEHLDTYEDLEDLKQAFAQYANSVPFFGAAILCLDDPVVQELIERVDRRVVTYGLNRQADIRAEQVRREGVRTSFTLVKKGETMGTINLKVPGVHNVQNALAAVTIGFELDVSFDAIKRALENFTGVHRRFEIKGTAGDVLVVDDYAHHPTEIRATLKATNNGWPDRRVVAVFQPHLYSRTEDFLEAFARSFFNADVLVITDIYPAREQPIPGVTGKSVADRAVAFGHQDVRYVADKQEVPAVLEEIVADGDIVVTLGAGDIWRYGEKFLRALQDRRPSEVEAERSDLASSGYTDTGKPEPSKPESNSN